MKTFHAARLMAAAITLSLASHAASAAPAAARVAATNAASTGAVQYRTIAVDGVNVFYREAGPKDAPVLLLLHGIVPAVGLLDVPLAAPSLHPPAQWHGVLALCWAAGLFLSVLLIAIVVSRLMFEAPMPPTMKPTLLILLASAVVGMSSYVAISGGRLDLFAQGLFGIGLFMLAVLVGRLRSALRAPFKLSWWAASFPLAACAIASLQVAAAAESPLADGMAVLLLAFASLVIGVLLLRTLRSVGQGRLREIV